MLFQTVTPFLPLNLRVPDVVVSELFKEMKGKIRYPSVPS
jgi:hypothetical protein